MNATSNLIVEENSKPGSLAWMPQRLRFRPADVRRDMEDTEARWLDSGRNRLIEGWASAPSVKAGQTLSFHVSMDSPGEFSLDLYRVGYYGGMGARLVASYGPLRGTAQPEPRVETGRLIECDWDAAHELTVPAEWVSGVYLGKLTRTDDGTENYLIFVVRDEREADLIAQTSDFTWQAYNRWPEDHSLYSNGTDNLVGYYGRDVAVSFDRPYLSGYDPGFAPSIPSTGKYFLYEFPFHYWAERQGFDLTYCSNLDTQRGTSSLRRAKGFLSIGHDEYWTLPIYENLMQGIEDGLSVAFFSGNSCCGLVEARPDASGRPDRVLSRLDIFGPRRSEEAGYKFHPEEAAFYETFDFPNTAPDEGLLIGARNHWPVQGCGDWVCTLPEHWVFDGTGMAAGEGIPNLVGHEWHGGPVDLPGLEVVSRGPTWDPMIGDGEYAATVYLGPAGNVVFNAASVWWATGLSLPPGFARPTWGGMPSALPDSRVQQITGNVLRRMIETSGLA